MATPFHVEIVTPEHVLYSGEAEEVAMRTDAGEIAFLAHHEDFVGAADITVVRVTTAAASSGEAGGEVRCAVHGGFVQFDQDANTLSVLAGVAELASEIDVARARQALESAEASEAGGAQQRGAAAPHAGAAAGADGAAAVRPAGALLASDSSEAAAKRARARLEAAGASPAT